MKKKSQYIFAETLGNPKLDVLDIEEVFDDLLRLSVGIEDIIEDIDNALQFTN
ncbi:hypothetical protein LGK95_15250 [Clostridium algoriphilum]|uniref:hypothetical protein n=1 Tax=Clostridium algoriphilum TaxID=198347 RepID=UPI001CF0DE5A|nr:hypothetical protein [Clostridium algoriphilum]MCB2294854.1 hypothetical protein [Clostridium algoriphilum]